MAQPPPPLPPEMRPPKPSVARCPLCGSERVDADEGRAACANRECKAYAVGVDRDAPVPEILAYIDHDGERWIVTYFPARYSVEEEAETVLQPDQPYHWRQAGQFIDRSEECHV